MTREKVSRFDAVEGLEQNSRIIDSEKQKTLWNLNVALLYLCEAVGRLDKDMGLLHNKLDLLKREVDDLPRH